MGNYCYVITSILLYGSIFKRSGNICDIDCGTSLSNGHAKFSLTRKRRLIGWWEITTTQQNLVQRYNKVGEHAMVTYSRLSSFFGHYMFDPILT